MPLASLIAVVVRILALQLVLGASQSTYLAVSSYMLLSQRLNQIRAETGVGESGNEHLIFVLLGYIVLLVVIPLVLWYRAGWIAKSLVGSFDCSLQLGVISRNDLYQLAFIAIGTMGVADALPGLLGKMFDQNLKHFVAPATVYQFTKLGLGILLIVGNKLLLRWIPSAD